MYNANDFLEWDARVDQNVNYTSKIVFPKYLRAQYK